MIRFFDLFFASLALIAFLPLFVIVSLILRFSGEGEVFYRQTRIGKNGKNFKVMKFATMLKDSPSMTGGTITVEDDPRILPVGRFLRKTKINELPQLINVIYGEMSLIGPRPMAETNFNYYEKSVQEVIMSLSPGLSGIASIIFRDEEKLLSDCDDRAQFYGEFIAPFKASLELWYAKNMNLRIYLLLILVTMYTVVTGKHDFLWRMFPELPYPPKQLSSLR